MGTTLTVTARGQVTLRKEVLRHLGVKPGEKVVVDFLPAGRAELRAATSPASIDGFHPGRLRHRGAKPTPNRGDRRDCRARVGGRSLRVTVDTNVLVRAAVGDDPDQSRLAADVLREAEIIAVTLPTLCEFVWVLARGYAVEGLGNRGRNPAFS